MPAAFNAARMRSASRPGGFRLPASNNSVSLVPRVPLVGEMMSVEGAVEGSGAYVAIERVTGTLAGRKGSFALVHSGTMRRGGEFSMIIRVVPDSGTDELTGLSGSMEIVIEGGNHFYKLDYVLPEA